jgi:hypothetical protein
MNICQNLGIEIHPTPNHIAATAQTLDINVVHDMFGNPNSHVLAATAAKYGFKTKNALHSCSNCGIGKASQKNLSKLNATPATEQGGWIKINISSVQSTSYNGANLMLLIQEDFIGYLWSYVIKSKSDIPETTYAWLMLIKKDISLNVKSFRLDNSGANNSFHELTLISEFKIMFDFTIPDTPQHIGKVECAFATLLVKVYSC